MRERDWRARDGLVDMERDQRTREGRTGRRARGTGRRGTQREGWPGGCKREVRERERGTSGHERQADKSKGLVGMREAWRERGTSAPEKGTSKSHEWQAWQGVCLVGGKLHGWMQCWSGPHQRLVACQEGGGARRTGLSCTGRMQ